MKQLLLILMLTLTGLASAESLRIPLGQQGNDLTNLPQYGESRRNVLERFGLADEEHPSVGNPPITRWDYREFSVYFENDHVINSVRHHSNTTLHNKEQQ
jgi:hypothetical protein